MFQRIAVIEKRNKVLLVMLFLSLKKTAKPRIPIAAMAIPTVKRSKF